MGASEKWFELASNERSERKKAKRKLNLNSKRNLKNCYEWKVISVHCNAISSLSTNSFLVILCYAEPCYDMLVVVRAKFFGWNIKHDGV